MVKGPDATTIGRFIALQRARQGLNRAARGLYNGSVGWALPTWRWGSSSESSSGSSAADGGTVAGGDGGDGVFVPINTARLVDDLLAVHGWEVMVDGVFNADPHPGNILYIEATGSQPEKLGLIDYGQVT
jgi:hypothetical protein